MKILVVFYIYNATSDYLPGDFELIKNQYKLSCIDVYLFTSYGTSMIK